MGDLLAAGAVITISSDDPTMFASSVAVDLHEIAVRFDAHPRLITLNAARAAFLPPDRITALAEEVDAWWAEHG